MSFHTTKWTAAHIIAIAMIFLPTYAFAKCDTKQISKDLAKNFNMIQTQEEQYFQPIKKKVEQLGKTRQWDDSQTKTYLAKQVAGILKPSKKKSKQITKKIKKVAFMAALGDKKACEELHGLNVQISDLLSNNEQKWVQLNKKIDQELATPQTQ